jgi:hypothetical protein
MTNRPAPCDSQELFQAGDIEFLDRILHDIFGMGLKLEYCLTVLDDAPAQARTGMEGVVTSLNQLVEPIRAEIRRLDRSRKLGPEIDC